MKRPSRPALLIALVPFTGVCLTVALWDRETPVVLGLPFNFFWILAWSAITPPLMLWAERIERRR